MGSRVDIHAEYIHHTPGEKGAIKICVKSVAEEIVDWVPWSQVIVRGNDGRPVRCPRFRQSIIVNMPEKLARDKGFI